MIEQMIISFVLCDYFSETYFRPTWDSNNVGITLKTANYTRDVVRIVYLGYDMSKPSAMAGILVVNSHGSCDNIPPGWLTNEPSWNDHVSVISENPGQNGWSFDNLELSTNLSLSELLECTSVDPWINVDGTLTISIVVADVYTEYLLNNTRGTVFPGEYAMVEEYSWIISFNASSILSAGFTISVSSASVYPTDGLVSVSLCTSTSQNTTLISAADISIAGVAYNLTAFGRSLDDLSETYDSSQQCWVYTNMGEVDTDALSVALNFPITFSFGGVIEDEVIRYITSSIEFTIVDTSFVTNASSTFACFYDAEHTIPMASHDDITLNYGFYCTAPNVTLVIACADIHYEEPISACTTSGSIAPWTLIQCPYSGDSRCVRVLVQHVGSNPFAIQKTQYITYRFDTASSSYDHTVRVSCPTTSSPIATMANGDDVCLLTALLKIDERTKTLLYATLIICMSLVSLAVSKHHLL